MATRLNPVDVIGVRFVEQVSFAAGDPGSGYTAIRTFDTAITLEHNMIEVRPQKSQYNRGQDPQIPAGKGGTLSFKMQLRSPSSGEPDWYELAKHCGLESDDNTSTNTTVDTGGTTGTTVDVVDGSGFSAGQGVFFFGGGGSALRFVQSSSASQITVDHAFGDYTPGSGDVVLGVYTLTPPTDRGEPDKYFTFEVYRGSGASNAIKYVLTGCSGMMKIETVGINTNPMVTFEFQVDSWTVADDSGIAPLADLEGDAIPLIGSPFYVDDDQTKIQDFSLDPGANLQPYLATEGSEGRCGWLFANFEPVAEITPYADVAWYTKLSGKTTFNFATELLDNSNQGWAVWIPAAQVTGVAEEATENEHQSTKPSIIATDPGTGIPLFAIAVRV